MQEIAKFFKVSTIQFKKDFDPQMDIIKAGELLESISIPKRSTSGSAGYDFVSSKDFILNPGETIIIPTGIRCRIDEGWFLMLAPRSGLGFKYRLQLDNTVGIIDSDYFSAENEGHIMIKLTNDSKNDKSLEVKFGEKIAQGIFIPYGVVKEDDADGKRTGGFGSTGR